MKALIGWVNAMNFWFYDPLPCLNVKVVCGPRVLVVVHCRREDHGKDLQLSQPMLQAKEMRGGGIGKEVGYEEAGADEGGRRRSREVEGSYKKERVFRRRCSEMEKIQMLTGKKEGKVINTWGKNGQELEKRNEKPVNGKKGNAGNGTLCHKDLEEK